MEIALNFLLKNWIMIGLEVLVFFVIGLTFAKMIWGRHHQRLFAAINENMNLAGQWQALGGAQRDLFKKLRNRWQSDRDSWEAQVEELTIRLKSKEATVQTSIPEPQSAGTETALARVAELEALLDSKDEEIESLNHSQELRAETDEVRSLRARVNDLEQDLIDAHDELHLLREKDEKSAEVLSAASAGLGDVEPESVRIRELEAKIILLESGQSESGKNVSSFEKANLQLAALLKQRSRELKSVRMTSVEAPRTPEAESVPIPSESLAADDTQWKAKADELQSELDEQIDEHAESIQGLYQQISNLEVELQKKEDEIAGLADNDTIGNLLAQDSVLKGIEGEDLPETKLPDSSEDERAEDSVSVAETDLQKKDHLIETLRADLADALDEMADVRSGYNGRSTEISLLEARIGEEEEVNRKLSEGSINPADFSALEKEVGRLTSELKDSADELVDVRRGYNENRLEFQHLGNQIEELDAIIEDRNEEVASVTSELESQRELIRNLRVKVAEQEGDLEGLTEQNVDMAREMAEKTSVAEFLTARIAEVELALGNRYEEINRMSSEHEIATRNSVSSRSHAEELSKELGELKWDNGLLSKQNTEFAATIESNEKEISEMTAELTERRQNALLLEDRYNLLKGEVDERADALSLAESERASSREAMEAAARASEEFQARIAELETANHSLSEDIASMQDHIRACEETIASREESIASMKLSIDSAETENDELNSRLAALENSRESLESSRTKLSDALETKTHQLGDFSDRINRLIHGGYQSFSGDENDGGGSAPAPSNFFSSDDEQINALGESIALLESRAIDAEQNFGSCENELVVLREEIIEIKQAHRVELVSRTEEIELLQSEVQEAKEQLQSLSDELDRERQEIASLQGELSSSREGLENRSGEVEKLRSEFEEANQSLRAELEHKDQEIVGLQEGASSRQQEFENRAKEIEALQSQLEEAKQQLDTRRAELEQMSEEVAGLSDELGHSKQEAEKRTEEIAVLREEIEARSQEIGILESDLEKARLELAEAREELEQTGRSGHHQLEAQVESSSHLKELVESLRGDLSSKQLAIRELEDQLAYERDRDVFRDQEMSEPVPVEELNRVEAMSENRIEESGDSRLSLFFNEGTVTLSGDAMERIDQAAREIRGFGRRMKLSVVGYAGAEGSAAMNESLSARRADAVRERLMENGISQSLISVHSAGEDESQSGSENPWKARRVEITLVPEPIAETIN